MDPRSLVSDIPPLTGLVDLELFATQVVEPVIGKQGLELVGTLCQ